MTICIKAGVYFIRFEAETPQPFPVIVTDIAYLACHVSELLVRQAEFLQIGQFCFQFRKEGLIVNFFSPVIEFKSAFCKRIKLKISIGSGKLIQIRIQNTENHGVVV